MNKLLSWIESQCVGKSAEYAQGFYEGYMEEHAVKGFYGSSSGPDYQAGKKAGIDLDMLLTTRDAHNARREIQQ